jgi:hypothetical protein
MKTFKPFQEISNIGGWVMKIDVTKLISSLESKEIDVLLKLYYCQEEIHNKFNDFKEEIINSLNDKNLISINIESDENIVDLTDYGLSVCGSVMFHRVNENSTHFQKKIQELPERFVACLVNRILWKDVQTKENGFIDQIIEQYVSIEKAWYERVLLEDKRIDNAMEQFYYVLEDLGFIENFDGQRWCSPEVENFLKEKYNKIMDLTWAEEDSLKYYFFFFVYAKEQKNLINFSRDKEEYRSKFYGEEINQTDYLITSDKSDPKKLLTALGLSEKRIISFLEEMQGKEIVGERYYPLSASSFFNDDEKIFVIKDIKSYMDYIKKQFLSPVVESLIG